MRNTLSTLILLSFFFTSCDQKADHKTNAEAETSSKFRPVSDDPGNILKADPELIRQYRETMRNGDVAEKNVSRQTLENIKIHANSSFDNTILTIGNIDGIGEPDTISTRIFIIHDTVYVHSRWIRNNSLLWESDLTDPYMLISHENPLFEFGKSPVWTRLTYAKNYTVPELSPISEYGHIGIKWVLISGMADFERFNLSVDSVSYQKYVSSFKGMLLEHGEPEVRQLSIWHEPTKRFVSYYTP